MKGDDKYRPIVIPRNKKYGNNYWISKGLKVGEREVTLYSDLEFDHWVSVETHPNVLTYCEQPLEIPYVTDGKLRTTIFDMWIRYKDGSEVFVEVKYEKELRSNDRKYERTKRQIEAQEQWCKTKGIRHEVRTEALIRAGRHTIENKVKMLSNVLNHPKPACLPIVEENITSQRTLVGELCIQLEGMVTPYDLLVSLQWLCYEGIIWAELDTTIWGNNMEVWKSE